MERPYRKHIVFVNNQAIFLDEWMRQNPQFFKQINGVPTAEQIGKVLVKLGFKRNVDELSVIYT